MLAIGGGGTGRMLGLAFLQTAPQEAQLSLQHLVGAFNPWSESVCARGLLTTALECVLVCAFVCPPQVAPAGPVQRAGACCGPLLGPDFVPTQSLQPF